MRSKYLTEILFAPQLQPGRVESISGFYCIATPVYSKPYNEDITIGARAATLSVDEFLLVKRAKYERTYSTNLVQNKIICYT